MVFLITGCRGRGSTLIIGSPTVVTGEFWAVFFCGGNRTRHGADTQQVLASVVRTARQRDLNLPALFAAMLRAPNPLVPDELGLPPPLA